MKGYKGFDKDLRCRGFQYEVGKTYEEKGGVSLCESGFHFCKDPKQIVNHYNNLTSDRYCEIEAGGEIIDGGNKCVCSKITIVREIPLQEFLMLVNEGDGNTGWSNEGDSNEGSWNKGDSNKGDRNRGDSNEGDQNIGLHNRGDNLCGLFNTDSGCVIFNKYTRTKWTDIVKMDGYYSLSSCIQNRQSPTEEQLEEIKKLPNFSEKVMNELIFGKKECEKKDQKR